MIVPRLKKLLLVLMVSYTAWANAAPEKVANAEPEKGASNTRSDESKKKEFSTSSNDNYNGDCFHLYIKKNLGDPPKSMETGWYLTTKQEGNKLTLYQVNSGRWFCDLDDLKSETEYSVDANEFDGIARRTGWVYGGLILPYKYHYDDKSISGETTIGPYVGRRSTLGDTSFIWAVSAGVTPISVESTDQNGNPKSTPLTAFTYAVGWMFEFNKGSSPFRGGVFFGKDIVSKTSAVPYKHNRKNWVAFQLGWDFTQKSN